MSEDGLLIAAAVVFAARCTQKWPETPAQREIYLKSALSDAQDLLRVVQQTIPPPGTLRSGVKPSAAGIRRRD